MTWKGKSKTTSLGYKIFIRVIRLFGLNSAYFMLRFVLIYYILFAKVPKQNLREFYSTIPTIPANKISKTVRKNFRMLGEAIVDRFAYLLGKGNKITYTQEGEEYLREFVDKKQPLVLVSAHLGNWEIAANLLEKLDAKVNAIMYDGEAKKIKSMLKNEVGEVHFKIIPIKEDISHILNINHALKNGEFICILGDRYMEGSKTIETELFGRKVDLPYGPFQIATRMKAHHSFIFIVKNGKYNYHFTATKPELVTSPTELAEKYVKVLEERLKENPEQWFNYHKFYKD